MPERVAIALPAPDGERAGLLDYGPEAVAYLEGQGVDLATVRRDFRSNGRARDREGNDYAGPVNVWTGTREVEA